MGYTGDSLSSTPLWCCWRPPPSLGDCSKYSVLLSLGAAPDTQLVIYPWRCALSFPHHFSPKSRHVSVSSLSPCRDTIPEDNSKPDLCPEHVLVFNPLAWLSGHRKVSPWSGWTPPPWPPFGHVLYRLSPHYPRRRYKVLTYFREQKVLEKHGNIIKLEVSPFFKHSCKSCRTTLSGELTGDLSRKAKLRWLQKGPYHFPLAISQASCRPAVAHGASST